MEEAVGAIQGVVEGRISYHYDVTSDVLYLRLLAEIETEAYGDEDDSGMIVLRSIDADRPVGMTIVDFRGRFAGNGAPGVPDGIVPPGFEDDVRRCLARFPE